MTICLATTHFAPVQGGIANYYNCLAKLLTDAGHRVIVLTVSADPVNKEEEIIIEEHLTKVTLYTGYRNYINYYSPYFRPGSYAADHWIATGMAMRDWLLKNSTVYGIDLIETIDYGGAGIFLLHPDLPPVVIDGHSSATQIDRVYPMNPDDHLSVIRRLEALSYQYADAIIAHSPMNQEELMAMTGRPVYFSRAPWELPLPAEHKPEYSKNIFIVLSSLQMIKGAETLAMALTKACLENKELKVYWAGEDSWSAPGATLTSCYLQEKYPAVWGKHLIWLNQKSKDEVSLLTGNAEAVIIPSLWDTFNYVVPETIYANKPLILSDKTGALYLVRDHPLVTIFPAGDAEELARILLTFSSAANHLPSGLSPLSGLNDYFSPGKILEERMKVYQDILGKERKASVAGINEAMKFLEKYTTKQRKFYYRLRNKIKSLLR